MGKFQICVKNNGTASLLERDPVLVKTQWFYARNAMFGLYPENISYTSKKRVWWKCCIPECSWAWKASPSNRITKNSGCPSCANKTVNKGFNDLESQNPRLMREWIYSRNALLKFYPDQITRGFNKKVWWKCSIPECGWCWQATVKDRTGKNTGCPSCSGHVVNKGFNDLATTHPHILPEWDYEKNGEKNIFPDQISKGFKKKVFWKCFKGHRWSTTVGNRIVRGSGCKKCSQTGFSQMEKELLTFVEQCVKKHCGEFCDVLSNNRRTVLNPKTGNYLELDVYIPGLKLAFEFDGDFWHSDSKAQIKGYSSAQEMHEYKDNLAKQQHGIDIIHIKEHDWRNNRLKVETEIEKCFSTEQNVKR